MDEENDLRISPSNEATSGRSVDPHYNPSIESKRVRTSPPTKSGTGCLAFSLFGLPILIVVFLFLGGCIWYGIAKYNDLQGNNQNVLKMWSDVETAYQKRFDMIPNIVSTVKGYAAHESSTLTAVTEARAKISNMHINTDNLTDEDIAKFEEAQNNLSGTLSKLMMVQENYPDLKADQHFMDLQNELKNVESEIKLSREQFNIAVQLYNELVVKFPSNLVARMFGFKEKGYFKAQEGAELAPEVKF